MCLTNPCLLFRFFEKKCLTNPCLLFRFFEKKCLINPCLLFRFLPFFFLISQISYTISSSFVFFLFLFLFFFNFFIYFSFLVFMKKNTLLTPVFFFYFYRFCPISRKRRKLDLPQLYFSFFLSNFSSISIFHSTFFFSSIFEKCALLTPVFFFDFLKKSV